MSKNQQPEKVLRQCPKCGRDCNLNDYQRKSKQCKHCNREDKYAKAREKKALQDIEDAKPQEQKDEEERIKVKRAKERNNASQKRYITEKKELSVKKELAERELCKRHLLPFTKRFVPHYDAGWVHIDICERLERFLQAVVDKESPRLMIFTPPRLGKSEIASVNFPAWTLGKYPDFKIIATSYAAALATDFSRQVRDRIKEDERFHALFSETKVSPSQQNVERWGTTKRGTYIAAGVDGPIGGRGGYLMIIDDPIKNRQDADSEIVQDAAWKWYTSTFMTRTEPGGGILIIQTRWSDMDISQKLIDMMEDDPEAERWEVVSYPALAEHDEYIETATHEILRAPSFEQLKSPSIRLLRKQGEALHPARYDKDALEQRCVMMGPRDWSALYQQNPIPESGDFFLKDWFHMETPPSFIGFKHLVSVDLAIGQKEYNHKTAIMLAAIGFDGRLHIRHMIIGRMTAHEIVDAVLNLAQKYDAFSIGIENGALKLALEDQFLLRMKQMKYFPSFDNDLSPVLDKEVRARPFQGLMQAGMVCWPKAPPPWFTLALRQLLRFPSGSEDDIVDALAWMARMYHHVSAPRAPRYKNKGRDSWKSKLKAHQRDRRSAMSA